MAPASAASRKARCSRRSTSSRVGSLTRAKAVPAEAAVTGSTANGSASTSPMTASRGTTRRNVVTVEDVVAGLLASEPGDPPPEAEAAACLDAPGEQMFARGRTSRCALTRALSLQPLRMAR